MDVQTNQVLCLTDKHERDLGTIVVEQCEGDLLLGKFSPGPRFAEVAPVFRAFEEAADSQALNMIERLDAEIAAMKLQVQPVDESERLPIVDVQIWADGDFSCRGAFQKQCALNGAPAQRQKAAR